MSDLADKFVSSLKAKAGGAAPDRKEEDDAFEEAVETYHAAKDRKGRAAAMRALLSVHRASDDD